jgi:hypothetical protein
MAYSPEQRAEIVELIVDGLRKGTPLAVLCRCEDMPGTSTVYEWMEGDAGLSGRIARAREDGWDQIAQDALKIADDGSLDTIDTKYGPKPDKEWIDRSKLRVETRLKLLAKWDPKRYGDMIKHAGADGGPVKITVLPEDAAL